ncbi:NTP transferase domain-containing protein [Flavobacterium sp. PL002]|uniref:nucleotidyltransferase family protein n=1 Tax=Flavobacterium sp. PL002 TaxID=1897058 RepID=UPI00178789B1|nr:NTP transferase domain-containing protein [Flavobacterium sp. PL002]MBE0392894.1 Molybdenum cofactor guanylyltransferase [Flavobacterium sp. PL002]
MENETAYILLAGGKSERMGFPKGLLVYNKTIWILEQLNRIANSSITNVYIGLGYYHEDYFSLVPWFKEAQHRFVKYNNLKVKIIVNITPEKGSFSTLQAVLVQIPENQTVLIQPIDVPILNIAELEQIISTTNTIVQPQFEGKNGHPIQLSALFWNPLLQLNTTDEHSRLDFQIKKKNPEQCTVVAVQDSSIIRNLNTPADWENYTQNVEASI